MPASIVVPKEDDALGLIGKRRQADRFAQLAAATTSAFPELFHWLGQRPFAALEHAEDWDRVLAVLRWLRDHARPGIYLRQLDIPGVDTKFIEGHRGLLGELLDLVLPADSIDASAVGVRGFELRYGLLQKPALVRFRLLDPAQHLGPLSDVSTPAAQFARLAPPARRVFITENEVNGLAFPDSADTLVIFGLGYGLERLGEVPWLRERDVFYWGDLDTHGFAMLDRLRASLPSARSFLMDAETLHGHRDLWTQEPVRHDGPLRRLTEAEHSLYDDLRTDRFGPGVRLEQERIAFGWLKEALRAGH